MLVLRPVWSYFNILGSLLVDAGGLRGYKKGSHTYSQQLVENIGRALELNADEMRGFMGVAGF